MNAELNYNLIRMSDSELHEHACKNSERKSKWTKEEELIWAGELLYFPNLLDDALWNGRVQTIDGCTVDVDGTCPHEYTSPLVLMGIC